MKNQSTSCFQKIFMDDLNLRVWGVHRVVRPDMDARFRAAIEAIYGLLARGDYDALEKLTAGCG
nr:hypothetical protein [uncultured Albidiferax sp.]